MSVAATHVLSLAEARKAARSGRGRAIREEACVSQAELARALGVSQATLSRWESGDRRPRGEAAERYARLLRKLEASGASP